MKIFLSMPMRDKTDTEIMSMINEMQHAKFINVTTEDIFVAHGYDKDRKGLLPIRALGESIQEMAGCDTVMFWNYCCYDTNYRGCNVENFIAHRYGLRRLNYNSITKEVEKLD